MAPRTRSEKGKQVAQNDEDRSPESTSNSASQGGRRRDSISEEIQAVKADLRADIQKIIDFFTAQRPLDQHKPYPAIQDKTHEALPPNRRESNTPGTDLRSTLQTRRQSFPERGQASRQGAQDETPPR